LPSIRSSAPQSDLMTANDKYELMGESLMKKLVARMELIRGRLHAVVKEKGFLDSEAISLSQELDKLIMEFYRMQRAETPAQQLAARAI